METVLEVFGGWRAGRIVEHDRNIHFMERPVGAKALGQPVHRRSHIGDVSRKA